MHPRLAETAAAQGGVFAAADAYACGYTEADVRTFARLGAWHVVQPGAYVPTLVWEAADAEARHRLAVAARLMRCGPRTVAGHWSAVVVHGLPLLGKPPTHPVLTRQGSASPTRFTKAATLPLTECTVVDGIRVTTLPRTVVDVARRAPFAAAVLAADAALRRGMTCEELAATARRWSRWPYGSNAVRVAAFADGRAESPLESLGRVRLYQQGVESPEPQVEVWHYGRFVARVDHLWAGHGCVGEADGMAKYGDPLALRAEKRRQETIEQLGLVVVRYDWDEALRRPRQLAERFRDGFTRCRPLAPGVRFVSTAMPVAA